MGFIVAARPWRRPDADHRPILRPMVWPALAPGVWVGVYDVGDVPAVWDCGDVEIEEGGDEGRVGEVGEEVGFCCLVNNVNQKWAVKMQTIFDWKHSLFGSF
jgi:hypothetical protein